MEKAVSNSIKEQQVLLTQSSLEVKSLTVLLSKEVKDADKPTLDYVQDENFMPAYLDFYKELLEE